MPRKGGAITGQFTGIRIHITHIFNNLSQLIECTNHHFRSAFVDERAIYTYIYIYIYSIHVPG